MEGVAGKKLVQLFYFTRHGHRGPFFDILGVWPHKFSLLSPKGYQFIKQKGAAIREQYSEFFSQLLSEYPTLKGGKVQVHATCTERTISTAYALLAGILGDRMGAETESILERFKWLEDVAGLKLKQTRDDFFMHAFSRLISPPIGEKVEELLEHHMTAKTHFEKFENLLPLMDSCPQLAAFKTKITSGLYFYLLYVVEYLETLKAHDIPFPESSVNIPEHPNFLQEIYDHLHFTLLFIVRDIFFGSELQSRLGIHGMFGHVADCLEEGEKGPRLVIYSGHDTNMFSICRGFGLELESIPPLGSSVRILRYSDDSVEAVYDGMGGEKLIYSAPSSHEAAVYLRERSGFPSLTHMLQAVGNKLLLESAEEREKWLQIESEEDLLIAFKEGWTRRKEQNLYLSLPF